MKEDKSTSQSKIIILTSAISTLIYSAYIITIIFTPKYNLNGIIEGYIALGHSRLEYYNKPLNIDFLSTMHVLTIPALTLSIYQIIIALKTLINRYNKRIHQTIKLMLGGGLASINICGLMIGLFKIIEKEISNLNLNLNYTSSAGRITFGSTLIQTSQIMNILTDQWVIIIMTTIQLFTQLIAYIYTNKR